ncbi:PINIT domain-containing protein [Podospora didyma]|uniref:PINIT domain-containing protein n=1 Tax=Podospora didyma TaxID=330526 RepID=A0AAE0KED7_9PEZI|nr:PINIT domain-containing protein [Podospora didyma]
MALPAPTEDQIQVLIRTVQIPSIQKTALQTICAVNSLPKTGNKADLQKRIIALLETCQAQGDVQRLNEVRDSIYKSAPLQTQTTAMPPQQPGYSSPSAGWASSPSYGMNGSSLRGSTQVPAVSQPRSQPSAPRPQAYNSPTFFYKQSPFYNLLSRIGEVKLCDGKSSQPSTNGLLGCSSQKSVMAQHRNSIAIPIKAMEHHPVLQQCITDPSMRVMIFCSAGNSGTQDISFPHQSELKVNGGDIKANLRGLKNKPGSTRPVDITDSLRLKPVTYVNNVEFTYALTQKKFYLAVYVCKTTPVEDLVGMITKKIPKNSVITEITKKASDPDVIATAQNLSLKCPLSYMRLSMPCRATTCSHIQCFDATSYLQLQEQGPQWICPICNNPAPFETLAVDEYVREILVETSDSVEQVTIEPDGKWAVPGVRKEERKGSQETSFVDDDDLVVSEASNNNTYRTSTVTPSRGTGPASLLGTPSNTTNTSRDTQSVSRSGSKRPLPEVIDLTFSDDDDEPARPVKRANYGYGSFSGPTY